MKEDIKQAIIKHGENVKIFFNLDNTIDTIKLCKSLRRLEKEAYKISLDYCNIGIDEDILNKKTEEVLKKLDKILNFKKQKIKVFINYDARGYSLKIDSDIHRDKIREINFYQDFGGYGIIAPDFNNG
jgi:hypothetical protein